MHHYNNRDNAYRLPSENTRVSPQAFRAGPNAHSSYEEDSGINAYEDDVLEDRQPFGVGSDLSYAMRKSPNWQEGGQPAYKGMDVRLARFVDQHNVNMDDGAVIYPLPGEEIVRNKKRRDLSSPPCGCTDRQFKLSILAAVMLVILAAVGIALGVVFGVPEAVFFPSAQPWWKQGLAYEIYVPTFANDVFGSLGRLKDVTSRMAYISSRIQASAVILTGFVDTDVQGVRNWMAINQAINPEGDDPVSLIADLKSAAQSTNIEIFLGLPLYATSERHPWFQQSLLMDPRRFTNFYMWRQEPPTNQFEERYYNYNSVRKQYYRHVHGRPGTPLLNLTDPEVQTELQSVIKYWKAELGITGILITNSTNLLSEMAPSLTAVLSTGLEPETNAFTWFADNVATDALLTNTSLCYFELNINERITTRTQDMTAQLRSILLDGRLQTCSPVWRLVQLSGDFTDYFSLQQFMTFLPGMSIMKAGEEVQLMTGTTELIIWDNTDPSDYSTYWPINVLQGKTARQQLGAWATFRSKTFGQPGNIFRTGWADSKITLSTVPRTENLFVVQREYTPSSSYIATFFVSFQALNAFTDLADVVANPQGASSIQLVYESKNIYRDNQLEITSIYLTNNDVFITIS